MILKKEFNPKFTKEIWRQPAQILFQHLVVETVQMFADDEVILQLHLECTEGSLEVRQASVLSRESHRLHGFQQEYHQPKHQLYNEHYQTEA